ncbi:hypothetical protein ZIOFF_045203 [Zingiber officinale]|uniref:Uncharacterized protein n=1 Tax=Zingiber officinale TaxID=94328 RepID=A0A8J5KV26_ZINOF|nr:hypothetical protein ZIOFF_045203 [Zingiber officinale]
MVMAFRVLDYLWWRPKRVERYFAKQGIRGPPYRFFFGCVKEMVGLMLEAASKPMVMPQNQHNVLPRVLAFYSHWKKRYGAVNAWHDPMPLPFCSPFLLWFGPTPRLAIADPDLIREILLSRSDVFERYESHSEVRRLEGEGLVSLRGEKWAHHRKVLTPSFHIENLKVGPSPSVAISIAVAFTLIHLKNRKTPATDSLHRQDGAQHGGEAADLQRGGGDRRVGVVPDGDRGRHHSGRLREKLRRRQGRVQATDATDGLRGRGFPQRIHPWLQNTNSWKLEKEMKRSLAELIVQRRKRKEEDWEQPQGNVKDLLGLMIDASETKQSTAAGCPPPTGSPSAASWMTVRDIVEECKTFFFAGKQTTSNLLTWTTVLLAMHPEWQERARAEVLRVCGPRDVPSREHLPKLKTVRFATSQNYRRPSNSRLMNSSSPSQLLMIIYETLRLYPPAVATIRQAKADVELGGYRIPQGTELLIPIMGLHHDAELWGPDVAQFNPERFANGAARAARHPTAFIPFGLGPRMCIGQNLALLEAKITVAVLLQRFSIRLAPSYVHAPTVLLLLYPQFGAPVLFRPLTS